MASTTTREQLKVGRLTVALSNTGKVLFPGDEITKGELIGYYQAAAEQMLPYLRERPLAMARYPDGITGERIFQKNVGRHFPDWIPRVDVGKQGGTLRQVVVAKAADLVYLANQASCTGRTC
jgi:bifunctional non-homologous end joining protein LigD